MTLLAMVSEMGPFFTLFALYILLLTPFFIVLFQTETPVAKDYFTSIRTIFDGMADIYGYYILEGKLKNWFMILIEVDVVVMNIFLANFLVAILQSIYDKGSEEGDFAFK